MQTKTTVLSAVVVLAHVCSALESTTGGNSANVFSANECEDVVVIQLPGVAEKALKIPQSTTGNTQRDASTSSVDTCLLTNVDNCVTMGDCMSALSKLASCSTDKACVQNMQDNCQILAKRQSGGGSPFNTILKDVESYSTNQMVARATSRISELIQAAIPAEVKRAVLDDPNGPRSLANEFSGANVPSWYARLPASVTNHYAAVTPPPTMTSGQSPQQSEVTSLISNVEQYKSRVASELSAMSLYASSESLEASRLSKEAVSRSNFATSHTDGPLGITAASESSQAVTMSQEASSFSEFAASASKELFSSGGSGSRASIIDTKLVLGSSLFGAVVCLGFAIAL